MNRKLITGLLFLLSFKSWGQQNITISHQYTAEEQSAVFSSVPFQEILRNLEAKLDAFPEDKKKTITDSEIAFRWGTDWPALMTMIEQHQMTKPLYAMSKSPKQYLLERFIARPFDKSKLDIPLETGTIRIPVKAVSYTHLTLPTIYSV